MKACVCPLAMVGSVGATVIVTIATGPTVTVVLPEIAPIVAWTVAVPSATAWTSPPESVVA